MARMKRIVNRYGKITLASLGGCLVSIGAFLIVLASLTVTDVARADECMNLSSPWSWWYCTQIQENPPLWRCCPDAPATCNAGTCDDGCAANVNCPDNGSSDVNCKSTQGTCDDCECNDADMDDDEYRCECS